MNILIKVAGVVSVALALNQNTQAVPIGGFIGFTGGVVYDWSGIGNATAVTSWINPTVTVTPVGAYSSIVAGSAVTFAHVRWNFNTTVPILNFWSVGGFSFDLLSSSITAQRGGQDGYVVVSAFGIVRSSNYEPTFMRWNFTSQDPISSYPPMTWNFSASGASFTPVPDGGQTVMLFGFALSSLALLRRHFTF